MHLTRKYLIALVAPLIISLLGACIPVDDSTEAAPARETTTTHPPPAEPLIINPAHEILDETVAVAHWQADAMLYDWHQQIAREEAEREERERQAAAQRQAERERQQAAAASNPTPPPSGNSSVGASLHPFLVCTRYYESDRGPYPHDRGYRAGTTYRGAYQFHPTTWNSVAQRAGRNDLVGVDPAAASVADQDAMALVLYQWQGNRPWGGRC